MVTPYIDDGSIRTFDVSADGYVWHRDKESRTIKVLNGDGWQLQFDDCLPILLYKDVTIDIPQGVYHRLIKGCSNLQLEIIKHEQ